MNWTVDHLTIGGLLTDTMFAASVGCLLALAIRTRTISTSGAFVLLSAGWAITALNVVFGMWGAAHAMYGGLGPGPTRLLLEHLICSVIVPILVTSLLTGAVGARWFILRRGELAAGHKGLLSMLIFMVVAVALALWVALDLLRMR